MLTRKLNLDNTTNPSYITQILQFIRALPRRPRRARLNQSPQLCGVHHLMNPEVTTDILQLIQREITVHFHPFDTHPAEVPPFGTKTLADLRALKRMWIPPNTVLVPPKAWQYQANKCPGCILARIGSKKETLRDLRIVLLTRIDECCKDTMHRLITFIDDYIGQFGNDEAEEIFATVINLAQDMKDIRRACINAGQSDREHSNEGGRKSHPVDSFSGHETGKLRPSEPSLTSHQAYHRPPKADYESGEAWGDLPQEIDDVIEIYTWYGRKGPYDGHILVPEAMNASDNQDRMLWTNRKSKRDGDVGFPSE
ncbi:hypothetical protein N7513_007357 [Penicillium frequentans]|nr:hypothetical protein N7513_007357 [Penicillium glabrum]